jgi:hypothetical protein
MAGKSFGASEVAARRCRRPIPVMSLNSDTA